MTDDRAPVAVALDAPDLATLTRWAGAVAPSVTTLKVGLEVFCRDGRAAGACRRSLSYWTSRFASQAAQRASRFFAPRA